MVFLGDFAEHFEGGALPEQIHGDNALGMRSNLFFDAFWGNLERFGVDICKNGGCSEKNNAFCWGNERKVGDDHLVTGA